jgi:superfamily II DNA/RNA helicase
VLVCTPAHLSSLVRGPIILDEGLFQHLRHLVLDEVSRLLPVCCVVLR